MFEQNNVTADMIESIERLDVELKALVRKHDQTIDPEERKLLKQEIEDLKAELKYLQAKLE